MNRSSPLLFILHPFCLSLCGLWVSVVRCFSAFLRGLCVLPFFAAFAFRKSPRVRIGLWVLGGEIPPHFLCVAPWPPSSLFPCLLFPRSDTRWWWFGGSRHQIEGREQQIKDQRQQFKDRRRQVKGRRRQIKDRLRTIGSRYGHGITAREKGGSVRR